MRAGWLGLVLALLLQPAYAEPLELRIDRITPEGTNVPAGREIVIQFSRPVVPIGDMAREAAEIPVVITPSLNCQWRWLNSSALACQLGERDAMQRATAYRVTVSPGIQAEDGATTAEAVEHHFTTERPDVRYSWFKRWLAPTVPLVRLTFSQSVTKSSIEASLAFMTPEGAPLQPVTAESDPDDREMPMLLPLGGGKALLVQGEPVKSDDDPRLKNGETARRIWLVRPVGELPEDATVSLRLKPGLVGAEGAEKSTAERELTRFQTFPAFHFLGVRCFTNEDDSKLVLIPAGTQQPELLCNPLRGAALSFSAPVLRSEVQKQVRFHPDLAAGRKDIDLWGENQDYSRLISAHEKDKAYDLWLPGGLKAAEIYHVQSNGPDHRWWSRLWRWVLGFFGEVPVSELQDEFGRSLPEGIDTRFATNHRKPNFEIIHNDAVLERATDSEVPLYVNNLQQTRFSYRSLTAGGLQEGQTVEQSLPAVQDIQFAVPFDVRGMLRGESGAVYGTLATEPAVSKYPGEHRLFAQVTPFQLHVKLGHYNSLVWVTDLATGAPVEGAKVTVYPDRLVTLGAGGAALAEAETDTNGLAELPGTESLDPALEFSRRWQDSEEMLFVKVQKGDELALMPLSGTYMIDAYRSVGESVYPESKERYGHMKSWGTTAQAIYSAGDMIQYVFYVRQQNNRQLVPPPEGQYHLEVFDPTGAKVHEVKAIRLSRFGSFAGEVPLAKQAAVGWYQFRLTSDFATKKNYSYEPLEPGQEAVEGKYTWFPLKVLVSDFTPVPFRVSNGLNGDRFEAGAKVTVETAASLHSGGAYGKAGVRVTALLQNRPFEARHPVAKHFTFGSYRGEQETQQIFQKQTELDAKGNSRLTFSVPQSPIYYGRLQVESAVQDDRGKSIARQSMADYIGVERLVGLKADRWMYPVGEEAGLRYLVVDSAGQPVKDHPASVRLEYEENKAARVKGAGNAYVTEITREWVEAARCEEPAAAEGTVCRFTPEKPGYYRATASTKDAKGREHQTELYLYVTGTDYVQWDQGSDASLEIVAEKNGWNVGDTARFLIKNPYPKAKALVTVERYGVIDRFTTELEGSTPVVEVPVTDDHVPGFYLSVVVFSPRVEQPLKGQVDLGKPSYRIGYVTVPVEDAAKRLTVTASSDRAVYKPREEVEVLLQAEGQSQEPVELAVAVLDAAVFDLITQGKAYFDPYQGFYRMQGLDVRNYSLLTRLVGRQKFEKKGANPGGDGGSDLAMRNLFQFVSYWNPSIPTDKEGKAKVRFTVPDNLTGWKVLALAVTPTDRMGLGEAEFKVTRPTEVRPVMPNQVLEGDRFEAGFSVMNRTDKPRNITVTIAAEGDVVQGEHQLQQSVSLAPYARQTVRLPVQIRSLPADRPAGEVRFSVTAEDAEDGDRTEHAVPVGKRRSLEVAANYGATVEAAVTESLAFPAGAEGDAGGVSVVFAPSVIGNVAGAFDYVRDYPYLCWEQRLTKAVMAAHYIRLRAYLPKESDWPGADTLSETMLKEAAGFQTPSGGMAYFLPQDDYADPYLSAYTALAFHWLKQDGYTIPPEVERKLQSYLDRLLKQEAFPDFYNPGMASSVRAVALAALAGEGKATLADLERYRPHLSQMSLFGKNAFLLAALQVKGAETMVDELASQLLSASSQTGGKFSFNEALDDSYQRMLATPLRENCAILMSFTRLAARDDAQGMVKDVPFKLVRMITQARGARTHWENTQENLFCTRALIDYAQQFEAVTPQLQATATLDGQPMGSARFTALTDAPVTLQRPMTPADPGRNARLEMTRVGEGRLYYAARMAYALKAGADKPVNAGIEIRREYSVQCDGAWQLLTSPYQMQPSEVVRVDLYLSLPTARHFVVVDDPVPGGLEPVNRDLATASAVDANAGAFEAAGGSFWYQRDNWQAFGFSRWSFHHQELRHQAARFYADYLPPGNYHLSYTAQAIAPGDFAVQPVKAEEMYDPDVYGKGVAERLTVAVPE